MKVRCVLRSSVRQVNRKTLKPRTLRRAHVHLCLDRQQCFFDFILFLISKQLASISLRKSLS